MTAEIVGGVDCVGDVQNRKSLQSPLDRWLKNQPDVSLSPSVLQIARQDTHITHTLS